MEKLTGVVLEKDGRHVVLLTPMGEFKRVRLSGKLPGIGEEISVPVVNKRFFRMPKAGWIAVAAAVLLLLVGNPLLTMVTQPPEAAMAYVSIDVKPSIELTVSDRYNVMDAQALNTDGQKVLSGLDLKDDKYTDAVAMIKARASEMGYLEKSKASTVLVSVAFVNGTKVDKASAERTLVAFADTAFADSLTKVAALHVPTDLRDSAKKKGISSGKYAVLIEAVNSGLPITEKDMQDNPVNVVIANAGGQPQQIITKAGEEKEFGVQEKKYIALASKNDSEQPTVAAANPPVNPAVSVDENENGLKPGTIPTEPNKERKYVETIRKSGSPEDQTGKNRNQIGVSAAVANNPPPVKTGSDQVSPVPNKDTTVTVINDQKTVDNYMGPDQTTNSGPAGSSDLNDMYKLKPNW